MPPNVKAAAASNLTEEVTRNINLMAGIMKKLILTLIFIVGLHTQTEAQQFQRGWMGNYQGVQHLIVQHGDDLQLTDSQKTELAAISLERRQGVQRNMRMGRGDRGSMRGNRQMRQQNDEARTERRMEAANQRAEFRTEMQQKIREILTDDQVQILHTIIDERAEKAHEYRVLRHEVMLEKAEISGDKAARVLALMNQQSENRLNMEKSRMENPGAADFESRQEHFRQMQEMREELKQILTAAEFENLQGYMGMQQPQNRRTERKVRVRNR